MKVVGEGVLTFEELQDILQDWISNNVPAAKDRLLSMEWVIVQKNDKSADISLRYTVRHLSEEELQQTLDTQTIAADALTANPALCKDAMAGDRKAVNALIGVVMQAMVAKGGRPDPEGALELVVNLLDLKLS